MSSRRRSGVFGTQDGADAVGDALQQVTQAFAYLQDVLRLQNQEAERNVQEAERRMQEALHLKKQEEERKVKEAMRLHEERLCEMNRNLQEKDDVYRSLQQQLQETHDRVTPSPSGAGHQGAAEVEEEGARRRVELRVQDAEIKMEEAQTSPSCLGEQLCEAVDEGSLSDVQCLIDSGADVNYTDQRGLTPLLRAAMHAHADIVSLFLKRGASVNAVGVYGNSALHMAALTRGCVELLVRAGADVNARNIDGETPLYRAEQSNNEEAVRALLAAGARSDLKPWGGGWKDETPLETTTSPAREAPTTRGAAAGSEGERAWRGVKLRVREGELNLEEARTSPSPLGEQLCKAANEGRLSVVRRLLDSGADVNYKDRNCSTPLDNAVWKTHVDVVSLLLQRGADMYAVDPLGCSALHLAAMRDRSGRCVELLVRAGADVNARNIDGETPLHRAAHSNNEEAVRALLAAGARRDLRPWRGAWKGKTPFETTTSPIIQDLLRL